MRLMGDFKELYLSLMTSCSVVVCEVVKLPAFCASFSAYRFTRSLFLVCW